MYYTIGLFRLALETLIVWPKAGSQTVNEVFPTNLRKSTFPVSKFQSRFQRARNARAAAVYKDLTTTRTFGWHEKTFREKTEETLATGIHLFATGSRLSRLTRMHGLSRGFVDAGLFFSFGERGGR